MFGNSLTLGTLDINKQILLSIYLLDALYLPSISEKNPSNLPSISPLLPSMDNWSVWGSPVDKRHSPNHYKFGDLHTFEWGEFMCCDRGSLRANILFNMQVICSFLGEMFIGFSENYESFDGQLI